MCIVWEWESQEHYTKGWSRSYFPLFLKPFELQSRRNVGVNPPFTSQHLLVTFLGANVWKSEIWRFTSLQLRISNKMYIYTQVFSPHASRVIASMILVIFSTEENSAVLCTWQFFFKLWNLFKIKRVLNNVIIMRRQSPNLHICLFYFLTLCVCSLLLHAIKFQS